MSSPSPPSLVHHATLHSPTLNTRFWSSQPHPSASAPLLATATSDKSVHLWDMRDWKLLSTINGGHKRSIRCVGWKDYGSHLKERRRRNTPIQDNSAEDTESNNLKDPVVLATGSFDANCGLWVWNRNYHSSTLDTLSSVDRPRNVPGAFDGDLPEQDFTNADAGSDENEEWHFSTLLTGPDSEIKDLQFSPPHYGANMLATCSRDKSVWVWEEVEPEEWETIAVLGEHAGDVKCVRWCEGARTTRQRLVRRLERRRGEVEPDQKASDQDDEDIHLGSRELLASGSYDDTIRLHHDDESEGDWITIAVLTGHDGTVWDVKFESYVNLASYPADTSVEEVIIDWRPRLISCSDDQTIRVWSQQLSEKERDERMARIAEARRGRGGSANGGGNGGGTAIQTGFSSSRIPSSVRVSSSTEKWFEETRLPHVHVRSVYAIDWSAKTGLVVSCGGDGLIAVYKEVVIVDGSKDVVMNGTFEHDAQPTDAESAEDIKKIKTEWKVVATMEAAHDEYEINHVCWAPKRDSRRQGAVLDATAATESSEDDDEEYIISSGDDGDVRVWKLPQEVQDWVRNDR